MTCPSGMKSPKVKGVWSKSCGQAKNKNYAFADEKKKWQRNARKEWPSNGHGNNKLFPSRKRCKNVAGEGKSNKMRAKLAVEHENSSVRPMHIHPWSSQLQRGSRRNNFSYTCHAPPTNRAKCVETLAWRTAPPPPPPPTNREGGGGQDNTRQDARTLVSYGATALGEKPHYF